MFPPLLKNPAKCPAKSPGRIKGAFTSGLTHCRTFQVLHMECGGKPEGRDTALQLVSANMESQAAAGWWRKLPDDTNRRDVRILWRVENRKHESR